MRAVVCISAYLLVCFCLFVLPCIALCGAWQQQSKARKEKYEIMRIYFSQISGLKATPSLSRSAKVQSTLPWRTRRSTPLLLRPLLTLWFCLLVVGRMPVGCLITRCCPKFNVRAHLHAYMYGWVSSMLQYATTAAFRNCDLISFYALRSGKGTKGMTLLALYQAVATRCLVGWLPACWLTC